MRAVQFDDASGYALLNDDGLCFAVKSAHHYWWHCRSVIDLNEFKITVVDIPEEENDRLVAEYCAMELLGEIK